jgi:hypothetical protein
LIIVLMGLIFGPGWARTVQQPIVFDSSMFLAG